METLGNDGIAPERVTDPDKHWSVVPSVDEYGNPNISPDEERVRDESDPARPGIKLPEEPQTIG